MYVYMCEKKIINIVERREWFLRENRLFVWVQNWLDRVGFKEK